MQFDHIGIPVESVQETEFWVAQSECWVTNPRTHPQRIEYLRFKTTPELEVRKPGLASPHPGSPPNFVATCN